MRYMLTLIGEEDDWQNQSPEDMEKTMAAWTAFEEELQKANAMVAGEALEPSSTGSTVRLTGDGERLTTDGPFAETKEQIGGFYVLDCESLEEAVAWAHKVPLQGEGGIEVRPVVDLSAFEAS